MIAIQQWFVTFSAATIFYNFLVYVKIAATDCTYQITCNVENKISKHSVKTKLNIKDTV